MERVRLVIEGQVTAGQQLVWKARFTHDLLVTLQSHQSLEDTRHVPLEIQLKLKQAQKDTM